MKEDEKTINQCDRFVCIAQHTLTSLEKLTYIDKSKCEIIYNAITDSYKKVSERKKNNLCKKYHIASDEKILFYAGRLSEEKGVRFFRNE